MSQAPIIYASQDEILLELASQKKLLTPQAIAYCRERLQLGDSDVCAIIVSECFLSEEQTACLYKEVYDKSNFCGKCAGYLYLPEPLTVCPCCNSSLAEHPNRSVTVAPGTVEEAEAEWETKFIAEVRQRGLFNEKAWQFFVYEQIRLRKMGYLVQLSTIIARSLPTAITTEIYETVGQHQTKVALVKQEVSAAEVGLPPIRKWNVKKARARAKARLAPEEQMMEELQEAMSSAKPKKAAKKKPAIEPEDMEELDAEDEWNEEDEEELASLQEALQLEPKGGKAHATPVGTDANLLQAMMQHFSQILNNLAKDLHKLDTKGSEAGEAEDAEVRMAKRGKRQLSAKEAQEFFEKGGSLERAYIDGLELSGITVSQKISLTNCVLANVAFNEVTFAENVDWDSSCFVGKAQFRGSTFAKDALFKNVTFADGADFTKVKFQGDTHFNSAVFKRYVTFNHSDFNQKAVFTRAYFAKGTKFAEVRFAMGGSFNDIGCDHRFYMEKCTFDEETTFSNARFGDMADFSRSKFAKIIKFKGTQFAKWVSFNGVHFQNECYFTGATAEGDVSFERAHFSGIIELRTLCAERNVNFLNSTIESDASFRFLDAYFGRLFITRKQLEGHLDSHIQSDFTTAQKEYGLLKNNFREINEYEQEDWAYLMEKRMERLGIKVKGIGSACSRFFNWLALDVSCGYGTKPLNIFMAALGILALFALFYMFGGMGQFEPKQLSFWNAILVSFRTFTNSSVGGPQALSMSWINYVMMAESFLGFFTISVLVVTFSRKVIR